MDDALGPAPGFSLVDESDGERTYRCTTGRAVVKSMDLAAIAKAAVEAIDTDVDGPAAEVLKRLRENGDLVQIDPAELVAELLSSID